MSEESNIDNIKNIVSDQLDQLAIETKNSIQVLKSVAVNQAWKILQLTIAISIQIIENIATNLSGPEKKAIALIALSEFYDKVFLIVDVPMIPNIIEPMVHKYVKAFLMTLVGASIDAMVTTFREIGVFKTKTLSTQKPKRQRKKS